MRSVQGTYWVVYDVMPVALHIYNAVYTRVFSFSIYYALVVWAIVFLLVAVAGGGAYPLERFFGGRGSLSPPHTFSSAFYQFFSTFLVSYLP